MTPIPDCLSTFIRFIQLKSLRDRTKEEYVRWVTRLARFCGAACASLLGQEQVLAFLHDLQQNHGYEGSTLNQAVCALRLFFRDHLGRADWTCWAQIRIKRTAPIPTVLSREEARVLLASVKEPRFVAVFSLMYHCGLRLGEACRLEVSHLDRERGVLRVLNGKGGKNREVPVAPEMFARPGPRVEGQVRLQAHGHARGAASHERVGRPAGDEGGGPDLAAEKDGHLLPCAAA
jgi:integrase/recombinase XerD